MAASDATIEAEGLKDFIKSVGKATVNFGKKVANNPVRSLETASKLGSAAASGNPRSGLSATPNLIKFATLGEGIRVVQKCRGLYLGKKKIQLIIDIDIDVQLMVDIDLPRMLNIDLALILSI